MNEKKSIKKPVKVKLFGAVHSSQTFLDEKINDWVEETGSLIVDVKYEVSEYGTSALVLYEEPEVDYAKLYDIDAVIEFRKNLKPGDHFIFKGAPHAYEVLNVANKSVMFYAEHQLGRVLKSSISIYEVFPVEVTEKDTEAIKRIKRTVELGEVVQQPTVKLTVL